MPANIFAKKVSIFHQPSLQTRNVLLKLTSRACCFVSFLCVFVTFLNTQELYIFFLDGGFDAQVTRVRASRRGNDSLVKM